MARAAAPLRLDELEGRITLTVEEVGTILRLCRTTAYEAARRGGVPSRRLGRSVVVPVPALLAWLSVIPHA